MIEHVSDRDLARVARRTHASRPIISRGADGLTRLHNPHTGHVQGTFVSAPPTPEQDYEEGLPGWLFVGCAFLAALSIASVVLVCAWHAYLAATRVPS